MRKTQDLTPSEALRPAAEVASRHSKIESIIMARRTGP